jgi:hypothetical protein
MNLKEPRTKSQEARKRRLLKGINKKIKFQPQSCYLTLGSCYSAGINISSNSVESLFIQFYRSATGGCFHETYLSDTASAFRLVKQSIIVGVLPGTHL